MRSNTNEIVYSQTSSNTSKQLQNKEKKITKNIPYPINSTYALQRRLIVPRWWVESLLFTLGKKQVWYEHFLNDRVDQRIYEYFKVTTSNVFLMFFVWHELTKLLFNSEDKNIKKVCFDLTPFLRGTEKQTQRILKTLEENLIKPTKMFDIKTVDKKDHKELVIIQNGFANIFRQVSLEQNVDGIWLTLHFSQKLTNLFIAPDCKNSTKSATNDFVSINPNLFYAMGSRVNLKTALHGLFLEYQKQVVTEEDDDFTAFRIASEGIDSYHTQTTKAAKLLFDNGIIRGHPNLPTAKISQLKQSQKTLNPNDDTSFIFTWNIGGQTKEARQFEALLSKYLKQLREKQLSKNQKTPMFKEPPLDELQKIRDTHARTIQNVSLRVPKEDTYQAPELKSQNTQHNTTNNSYPGFKPFLQKTPNFHACSEKELSIFVARFYESLSVKQKKMFESERRKMNNEQFRAFMIPILQRTHARLPT